MAEYCFSIGAPTKRYSQTAGIHQAPSMSRSEKPTNKQQDVNSKKRRGSRHHSPILESSRTTSRPRTRSLQYSPAEVMILSRLIQRNPLEHHFTQETKLTRLLHPRKQHPGSQGAGRYYQIVESESGALDCLTSDYSMST